MTRPANSLRGEAELIVAGRRYLLRPSFAALVAAEAELGSLFALVERAAEGELTLAEITALLWHCLDPNDRSGDRPDQQSLGEAVIAMGLLEAIKPVRAVLAEVLKGRG
jgi:hypothetical protein